MLLKFILGFIISSSILKGKVVDASNKEPLVSALVRIKELKRGVLTDIKGRFKFKIPPGSYTLEVYMLGYYKKVVKVSLKEGESKFILIGLKVRYFKTEEVKVVSSYGALEGKASGNRVLSRMDIITLPGAATDLFLSIKSLPGVNSPNDNASVSIQGGSPDEVKVYVNGLYIPEPFHYETTAGGLFSFIQSSMIQDVSIYQGGYPAEYGGALSGVMDITLKSSGYQTINSINMSMAGFSFTHYDKKFALTLNRGYTDIIYKIIEKFSGEKNSFTTYPVSWDIQSSAVLRQTKNSILNFFILTGGDYVGVDLSEEEVAGSLKNDDKKGLVGLSYFYQKNKFLYCFSTGLNGQIKKTDIVWWDIGIKRYSWLNNFSFSYSLNSDTKFKFGFETQYQVWHLDMVIPQDWNRWRNPEAPEDTIKDKKYGKEVAFWISFKRRILNYFYLETGLRSFYSSAIGGKYTLKPRLALAYKISDLIFRLGGGAYSQTPSYILIDDLKDRDYMYSKHLTFSAESKFYGLFTWQFAIFYKDYSKLPVKYGEAGSEYYRSLGEGYAYGLQLFLKKKKIGRWYGWLSYTYLRSFRAVDSTLKEYRSEYDTPNIVALVNNFYLGKNWSIGFSVKYSTGKPYTPVVDAVKIDDYSWRPIYGVPYSERLPDFFKVDMRVCHVGEIFGKAIISYIEFMNLTDSKAVLGYTYSKDYKDKKPIYVWPRMIVGGFIIYF